MPAHVRIFNTLSRSLEPISASDGKTVRFYTCGPTVYDYAHIGNFRTFVFEDVLRKTMRFFGMQVKQAMNITDVDDKTIKGAQKMGMPLAEFTKKYTEAFFEDLKVLSVEPVEFYPAATEYIPQMIRMCEKLIEKKAAYIGSDGSVYFAIRQFPGYGKLSHLHLEDLKEGANDRTSQDEYAKEQSADFVLWKAYDPARDAGVFWESPFGKGRPGWHLECSVMAQDILGETIDLHAGGVDLIFPHHENEIAQSECCSGKCFSKAWVHVEHLLVDNKKMSKSLGNFYTLRDLIQKGYSGVAIRFMLIQTHYRMQMNFTFQGLDSAKASLERIQDFIHRLREYKPKQFSGTIEPILKSSMEAFKEALADDINTPLALAALFDMIRQVNHACDSCALSHEEARDCLQILQEMDEVLGICSFDEELVPQEVQKLVQDRLAARKEKNWKLSDELRTHISSLGYIVEDTPQGSRAKKK
jgi:cysteinyl-tRNA synthetase